MRISAVHADILASSPVSTTACSISWDRNGVNPGGGEIEGQKLNPTLADLPEKPAVVDIVVPPKVP